MKRLPPMLMVISPAKTLDYESTLATTTHTQPLHLNEASVLMQRLRELSAQQIASLMGVSDKLAGLNVARYAQWASPSTPETARQALLAFKGDVYTGMAAQDFTEEDFVFAQQHLRILSGLYGVLRPLDLMMPYRLEMGIKLDNPKGRDLYAFWGEQISHWLQESLDEQGDNLLLNLASQEYFKAVRPEALRARIIDVEFRDWKNGQYKIISFYAKKARGMMARFVIRNRLCKIEDLQAFDTEGYGYNAAQSSDDKLVFLRKAD